MTYREGQGYHSLNEVGGVVRLTYCDGNCVICEEEEVGTGDQDYIISESRLYDAGGFGAMMM